jgi:hypothetical protein
MVESEKIMLFSNFFLDTLRDSHAAGTPKNNKVDTRKLLSVAIEITAANKGAAARIAISSV